MEDEVNERDDFDYSIIYSNIMYLLSKKDMKIGAFEKSVGVSPGYLSRKALKTAPKLKLKFIIKAADVLGVTIDTLLKVKLDVLTPTDEYLLKFLQKLIQDTKNEIIVWTRDADEIVGNPSSYRWFSSQTYGERAVIGGDCFQMQLGESTRLFLINVARISKRGELSQNTSVEMWIDDHHHSIDAKYLCGVGGNSTRTGISSSVDDLYHTVKECFSRPKLDSGIRNAIDAFMRNEMLNGMPF